MLEMIIEKVKEYKIAVGVVSVGALLGAGFLVMGQQQEVPARPVSVLAQEVKSEETKSSSSQQEAEAPESSQESALITVDVKGAVVKPGLYELKAGSRVNDAIKAAGGLTDTAESKAINLAQKLTDEAVVYVPIRGEEGADLVTASATSPQESESKTGKVNLNTASEAELQTISGIGQKRAADIISYRETSGGFKSVEDLQNVSGIGSKTLEKLKDYVTVD